MKIFTPVALLCGVLCAPGIALGNESQKLDPVFVTGTRSEQPQNRLPAAASVITRADIDASGVRILADALRLAPGIQVNDFFGDGSQYTIVDMRGFGAAANANTLILVDGRRLNNPDIAGPDLSSVSLKDVERIEILHGSAGTLYGDQAVGGVINIVTRQPGEFAGQVQAGYGSYDASHASASVGQRLGAFFYRGSVSASGSDNYRTNNRHENLNTTGRVGYDYGGGSVFLETGYVKDRNQVPGALTAAQVAADRRQCQPSSCTAYIDSTTSFQRLNWDQSIAEGWNVETDFTLRRGNGRGVLSGTGFTQDRKVWSVNPRVSGAIPMPAGPGLLVTGVDLTRTDYSIIAFGPQSDAQRLLDVYAQATLPLTASIEATVGARSARVKNVLVDSFGAGVPVELKDRRGAWEGGLAWKPVEGLRLFTRYDRNFRFAKADEYFTQFPPVTATANPLQTQTGDTYEIGADWKREAYSLNASVFQLDLDNEISYNPLTFGNFNLDDTRRQGLRLQAEWQALQRLKLAAGTQYLKAEFTQGPSAGNRVPMVARQTGRLAATLQLPHAIRAQLEVQATGKRPLDGDFSAANAPLPGFAVVNLSVQAERGPWSASARVANLFDREYTEYGALDFLGTPNFYPSPEINAGLTLGYSF